MVFNVCGERCVVTTIRIAGKHDQIPDGRSLCRLNFICWRPSFIGHKNGTSLVSPLWRLEF